MNPQSVWYQLYVGREEKGRGKVKGVFEDIDDLKKAIKEECSTTLAHCDRADLNVFPIGTKVEEVVDEKGKPLSDRAIDPGDAVPHNAKHSRQFLVVVAPPTELSYIGDNGTLAAQTRTDKKQDFTLVYTKSEFTIHMEVGGRKVNDGKNIGLIQINNDESFSRRPLPLENAYRSENIVNAIKKLEKTPVEGGEKSCLEMGDWSCLVGEGEQGLFSHLSGGFWNASVANLRLTINVNDYYGTPGEMFFQQCIYTPLSMLFVAAAQFSKTPATEYCADEEAKSSMRFKCLQQPGDTEWKTGVLSIRPDAATTTRGKLDCFGMMEIQPDNKNHPRHRVDCDRCVLMTALSARLFYEACLRNEDGTSDETNLKRLAIPFVIATGWDFSVYVTRIDRNGYPFVSLVDLGENVFQSYSLSSRFRPYEPMTCGFVALAVLLDELLELAKNLDYERKISNVVPPAFNKPTEIILEWTGSTVSSETQRSSSQEAICSEEEEREAMEAVSRDGVFENVEYPFTRVIQFHEETIAMEYQQGPLFYFKATQKTWEQAEEENTGCVFLKVWDIEEAGNTKEIDMEWRLLCRANDSKVSVAKPTLKSIYKCKATGGWRYWVIATEFVPFEAISTSDELGSFALSLVSTVDALHCRAGIVHCDLKPRNIRWSKGVVKLIDFGQAQLANKARWKRGTEGYEAPEILKHESASFASDAFSVGKTIERFWNSVRDRGDVLQGGGELASAVQEVVTGLTIEDPGKRMGLARARQVLCTRLHLNSGETAESRLEGEHFAPEGPTSEQDSPPRKVARIGS